MSCGLQNPPALPGTATRPLNWPGPGLLAPAGEANIWAASGCVWGFLSSLLDQPVPGVPSWEGCAQTLRRRRADTQAADPRRLPRKENATRAHSPACCNPLGWRHQGRSKNCVVPSAAGARGVAGAAEAHKNNPKGFICLCYRPLGCPAAGSRGPASAQLWGSAKCSVCRKLPKC